jgi:phosphoribosylformimino-5-aminoimidazole carboxamide ribotide isomerase
MIIFPAIDIKGGKVVRLEQGRFDKVTAYSSDPVQMAQKWKTHGAQWLHVVDLDGAQTGQLQSLETIKRIKREVAVSVQVGGGIRNLPVLNTLLDKEENPDTGGVDRVVLGTRAVIEDEKNKDAFKKILIEWGEKIAVSIDCKNGFIAQRGWQEVTQVKGVDLVKRLALMGVKRLIYTDIARDGTLTGPNFAGLEEILKAVKIPVIASGGISSIEDIKKLIALAQKYKNLEGAITGKAIYEGKLDLKEAIKLCSPSA